MVQKRHLAEDEYDVSPKHLKLDHSCELVPFLQFTKEDAPLLSDKDEACFFKPVIEVDYGFQSDKFTHLPLSTMKDDDYTLPGRLSTSSFASSTTSEEDINSKPPQRLLIQQDNNNTYSYLLQHPPLKKVPIGPQFQAEIPEWNAQHITNEIKFTGSCVISMPHSPFIQDNNTVGKGRADCLCKTIGSHKCTQQHIQEARETLKGNIGNKKFEDLGFGNMGELVANKWTEEDEQLFHEVVYSNRMSFGQNFWEYLEKVFPSRSNQELVSYYFNVFMLRIRAEQNRCDPVDVDSDDDEWVGSDGSVETGTLCKYDSDEHGNGIEDSDERGNGIEDSITEGNNPEFMFEHSDCRVWDIGYISCSRTEIETDLLPTCSMIEEVFGIESWNFDDDDKRSN